MNRMLKLVPLRFLYPSWCVCVWMIKLFNRIPNSIKYPFSSNSSSCSFSHFEREKKSVISFVIFLNPKMLTMCPQNRNTVCSQWYTCYKTPHCSRGLDHVRFVCAECIWCLCFLLRSSFPSSAVIGTLNRRSNAISSISTFQHDSPSIQIRNVIMIPNFPCKTINISAVRKPYTIEAPKNCMCLCLCLCVKFHIFWRHCSMLASLLASPTTC